ncbi:MAG: GTP-binding protein [Desulfarculaceae bacterium]|nr:GTP-binding protein [Desulfarculaceae bacterium]
MSQAIPVHLICGFLGAGKTTLLQRILAQQPAGESLAVLVNEFGKLGVDGELLDGFQAQVRELRAGCICCELRVDFLRTLAEIVEGFGPQRIVVDATGVADPNEMIKAVEEAARTVPVALGSVISLVEPEMFAERGVFGPFYENQIKAGDLVLLNKTDTIASHEVEPLADELAAMNPGATVLPVVHAAVERRLILEPGGRGLRQGAPAGLIDLNEITSLAAGPSHLPGAADGFVAFSYEDPAPLSRACLEKYLASLPWEVFRVKGFVPSDEGPLLVNYTYRRPQIEPATVDGPARLAFVGWQLDQEAVLAPLEGCRA